MESSCVYEGWLHKLGEKIKSRKKRYCVLEKKELKYYKDASKTELLGSLELSTIKAIQDSKVYKGRECAIIVTTATRTWVFWAESFPSQTQWIAALKRTVLEVTPEPTLAKKEDKSEKKEKEKEKDKSEKKEKAGFPLLLLGIGNAGKTTLIRQMRIKYLGNFSEQRCLEFRPILWHNILTIVLTVAEAAGKLGLRVQSATQRGLEELGSVKVVNENVMNTLCQVWEDPSLKKAYERRFEYHVGSATTFLMTNLSRMACSSYIPTNDDILRARQPTRGVQELIFDYQVDKKRCVRYRAIDVGGQRSERRKYWGGLMKQDEHTRAILLFVVSLSAFDEPGEQSVNAMEESMAAFKDLVADEHLHTGGTIYVLFNKLDALHEKLQANVKLTVCPSFSDYRGTTTQHAAEYVRKKFSEIDKYKAVEHYFITSSFEPALYQCFAQMFADKKDQQLLNVF